MINKYPLWKYLLVLVVLAAGALYALPNIYGEDPAVQISSAGKAPVDTALDARAKAILDAAGIVPGASSLAEGRLLIRLKSEEDQLKAKDALHEAFLAAGDQFGSPYVVALNLAPKTPGWLRSLNATPMNLGLDLRGGVHFLLEVDMDRALELAMGRVNDDVRTYLRENEEFRAADMRPRISKERGSVVLRFKSVAAAEKGYDALRRNVDGIRAELVDDEDAPLVRIALTEQQAQAEQARALEQNITTLRKRVNELGVAEPSIQQQGVNRIVVELPGVQDTARAKEILGATATLDFRIVEKTPVEAQKAADTGRIPPGTKLYYDRDGQPYLLSNRVIVSGKYINGASAGREQDSGQPAVFVNLNGQGGDMMSRGTKGNVGRLMAVVFIEDKQVTRTDADGKTVDELVTVEEVINSARILSQLGRRFQVTGLDPAEANKLALLLRAGSLAAPMRIVEERTVGPSLGAENIEKGFTSVVVGLLLVLIFMAIYYKVFGLIANVALLANIVIIVAVLGIIGATLTLPGIAGIVLTVGMAVDANVLIFERIREELRAGNSVQASIFSGYEKAFSTIADANVTTLIAAVILYAVGTGPIKGFAVTLSIGIATSMFTAIVGTRAIVNLAYGGRKLKSIAI